MTYYSVEVTRPGWPVEVHYQGANLGSAIATWRFESANLESDMECALIACGQ